MPGRKTTTKSKEPMVDAVNRVAKAMEKQNDLRRRFLIGVIFGVGTAVGASIIATFIIVFLFKLLSLTGINLNQYYETRAVLEQQIRQQTPQE